MSSLILCWLAAQFIFSMLRRLPAWTGRLVRFYSEKSSTKNNWNLPEISQTGEILTKEQRATEIANKVGIFKDNRPNVPFNWRKNKEIPEWKRQMFSLREKFQGEPWRPKKRLSRTAMEGIRKLKAYDPNIKSGDIAKEFKVSPEAVRRILRSKWMPNEQEEENIQKRWVRRGKSLGAFSQNNKKKQTRTAKRPSFATATRDFSRDIF